MTLLPLRHPKVPDISPPARLSRADQAPQPAWEVPVCISSPRGQHTSQAVHFCQVWESSLVHQSICAIVQWRARRGMLASPWTGNIALRWPLAPGSCIGNRRLSTRFNKYRTGESGDRYCQLGRESQDWRRDRSRSGSGLYRVPDADPTGSRMSHQCEAVVVQRRLARLSSSIIRFLLHGIRYHLGNKPVSILLCAWKRITAKHKALWDRVYNRILGSAERPASVLGGR